MTGRVTFDERTDAYDCWVAVTTIIKGEMQLGKLQCCSPALQALGLEAWSGLSESQA